MARKVSRGLTHGPGGVQLPTTGSSTNLGPCHGIWIEDQSKDTNRQKRTKQTEEVKKGELEDRHEHLANRRVAKLTA
uniref:Uncharacterized protein n=1 Tax=Solanum tuberosum TaxID=4113 RepID=M1DG70_SOLTU